MAEQTVIPFKSEENQEVEANPVICEVCASWDIMSAHWLLYDDHSFRCVSCGTAFYFEEDE
tara:strand:+ start:1024 stop:1206 length:183 start_codon:yes stop_codon:yes gene_type:complete